MEKTKKVLMILISFLLAAICTIIVVMVTNIAKEHNNNNIQSNKIINNTQQEIENINNNDEEISNSSKITILKDENTFFSIQKMIKEYLLYLNAGNKKAIYEIVDNAYIEQNMLSIENILEALRTNIMYDGIYEAKEIYVCNNDKTVVYYIYGTLEKNLKKTAYYIMMYEDIESGAYSLQPISSNEYLAYIADKQQQIDTKNIIKGTYNKIGSTNISNEELAKIYFNSYIHNARCYPEEAYNSLDEEYKNVKFGNLENYITYLASKSNELESLDYMAIKNENEFSSKEEYTKYLNNLNKKTIKKYAVFTNNETKYCIVIDDYNNYYIFEVQNVMDYKLILDTYTIELPEVVQEYIEEE